MISLQIPIQPLIFCAGNIVGVVALALFAKWLSWRQQKKMLDELSKIAVEFAPQEGEDDVSEDEVDQC